MLAAEILDTCKKLGISVYVEGDNLVCEPGSLLPPDLKPAIREHKAEIMALLSSQPLLQVEAPYIPADQVQSGEIDLPFPLGYGGLDGEQVAMAERINLALGVTDPLDNKLSVVNWLYQHYRDLGNHEIANQLKEAYWSLREPDPDLVALNKMGEADQETLLRRLRDGQKWLTDEYMTRMADNPEVTIDGHFQKALDTWVQWDAHLRQHHAYQGCIHGEGRRCPADSIVNCNACVGDALPPEYSPWPFEENL